MSDPLTNPMFATAAASHPQSIEVWRDSLFQALDGVLPQEIRLEVLLDRLEGRP